MFGRLGVDVVMPKPDEIAFIHDRYLDVVYDRSTPEKIDRLRELAHTLIKRDGAEAVLLAGTDLSMVMNEENAGFPTLDCAGVHIAEITKRHCWRTPYERLAPAAASAPRRSRPRPRG